MNALTPIAAPMSYGEIERLAASIAKSGLFGIKTTEQAMVLMMISHAEGRHPVMAARDYDIINGRPAKKAEAMARDFLTGGGKIEWHALTDDTADATFSHPQGGSARITWDIKRAMTAGLGGNANYKKYPRQMLRSRTVSEGVRTVWPMATSGMYVPEEAGDMQPKRDDFSGTTIQATADEMPPEAQGDYEFVTKQGSRRMATADEWIAAWKRLISNCQAADALDKLAAARDMNQVAILNVERLHPGSGAMGVPTMIADALAEPPKAEPAKSDFPGDWPSVENDPNSEAALDGILERGLP